MDPYFCESVLGSLPFGVCIVDDEGMVLGGNASLQRLLGWHVTEQPRQPLSRYLEEAIADPAHLLSWSVAVNDALSRCRTIYLNLPIEFQTQHEDASTVSVIGAIAPWQGPDTEQSGVLIVFCDSALHADLEGVRANFLSVVAHGLGSPLANIVAAADRLARYLGEDDTREKRLLEIVDSEAGRLGRVLKQFLSATPLPAEAQQPRTDVVALRPLIRRVAFTYRIRDSHRELAMRVPSNLPYVWGNADRIQEALCNLVDNALRHTPPGTGVEVSAEPRGDSVLVRVADHGPGLSNQDEEDILEASELWFQDDPSSEGQGLGLPIARVLIEGLGGQFWHEVPPWGGAAFCFTLPRATDLPGVE